MGQGSRSAFMMGRFEANVQGGHTQSRAGGSNGRSPLQVMAVITRSMTQEQREEESLSAKFQCVCRSTYKAGTWVFAVFSSILYTHKTKETTRYDVSVYAGKATVIVLLTMLISGLGLALMETQAQEQGDVSATSSAIYQLLGLDPAPDCRERAPRATKLSEFDRMMAIY